MCSCHHNFPGGMSDQPKTSGDLFIVDNSDDAWKGLRYLQDWTEIASGFDIATGFFEIGSLLALDGKWEKLSKIRILMGDEMSARTKQALLDGLKAKISGRLDASLEENKETVPLRLYSGKEQPDPHSRGVFLCYRLPAEDKSLPPEQAWEGEANRSGWYLYLLADGSIIETAPRIAEVIRSTPETPRVCHQAPETLREIRLKVEKHIKNSYLRQVQAPVGVKPVLKCWMEVN
jgi:hypothetical protein